MIAGGDGDVPVAAGAGAERNSLPRVRLFRVALDDAPQAERVNEAGLGHRLRLSRHRRRRRSQVGEAGAVHLVEAGRRPPAQRQSDFIPLGRNVAVRQPIGQPGALPAQRFAARLLRQTLAVGGEDLAEGAVELAQLGIAADQVLDRRRRLEAVEARLLRPGA